MDAAGTRTDYAAVAPFYDSELATRDDLPFWHTLVAGWKPQSSIEDGCCYPTRPICAELP